MVELSHGLPRTEITNRLHTGPITGACMPPSTLPHAKVTCRETRAVLRYIAKWKTWHVITLHVSRRSRGSLPLVESMGILHLCMHADWKRVWFSRTPETLQHQLPLWCGRTCHQGCGSTCRAGRFSFALALALLEALALALGFGGSIVLLWQGRISRRPALGR